MKNVKITSKQIAFIAVMCALANILGFFPIPIGLTSIHLMQLPIILTGLSTGSWNGGIVGFIGAISLSYGLSPTNSYILLGNVILGFFTGFFFTHLKELKGKPVVPQAISVLAAYIV